MLDKYFEKLGGRPQSTKLGKRKSSSQLKNASGSQAPKKSKRTNSNGDESMDEFPQEERIGTWIPKKDSWEHDIKSIDTVERDRDTGKLWAFLIFDNGKRSKVGMEMIYKHCPIAMLKFYERHLSVITIPRDLLQFGSTESRFCLPQRTPKAL